jgi:BASS family bile acid:Na+ symporter
VLETGIDSAALVAATRPALAVAARGAAALYVVVVMLSMGVTVGKAPPESKERKRRLRRLLLRGLAFNLVVLPLAAVLITRALHASGNVAIALMLLAATPGGRLAPQLAATADAELGLSVELTLFLAKLVGFTAPVAARWMLGLEGLDLPELRLIAQLLLLQFLPYILAKQLAAHHPRRAERLVHPLRIGKWTCGVLTLMLVLISHDLGEMASVAAERGWWAVLAFIVVGALLGYLLGGRDARVRRTFVISAHAPNLAVALMLAAFGFSDHRVQLATVAVWGLLVLVDVAYAHACKRGHRSGPVAHPA